MWVGAAQLTGPISDPKIGGHISAQNGWVELGPTDSSSSFFFNFGDRLDLAQPTGLGKDRSNPK